MEKTLVHKEGPFHFYSVDSKVQVELPDGHGPGLTKEELVQLSRGARYVVRFFTEPYAPPVCRHRCRECDETWTHDPSVLECRWAYDDLCGECAGTEEGIK